MSAAIKAVSQRAQRRVVITGMESMTSLGIGIQPTFDAMKQNKSGIKLASYKPRRNPMMEYLIGGILPEEAYAKDFIKENQMKNASEPIFAQANWVFKGALKQAGLLKENNEIDWVVSKNRFGVMTSMMFYHFDQSGINARYQNPMQVPQSPAFGLPTLLSQEYGIEGYARSTSNACASTIKACGDAFRMVRDGYQDIVVAGGFDHCVDSYIDFGAIHMGIHGRNKERPDYSLRAFDKEATGSIVGDGGGFLVVESLDGAKKRGAKILGEITGYTCFLSGESPLQPSLEGIQGMFSQISRETGVDLSDFDMISCQGSGPPLGAKLELRALLTALATSKENLLKGKITNNDNEFDMVKAKKPYITSFKGSIGHQNMASGASEIAICLKSMEEGFIPAIYGLENPIMDLNFVKHNQPVRKDPIKNVLKYALGMGMQTAAIAFKKLEE